MSPLPKKYASSACLVSLDRQYARRRKHSHVGGGGREVRHGEAWMSFHGKVSRTWRTDGIRRLCLRCAAATSPGMWLRGTRRQETESRLPSPVVLGETRLTWFRKDPRHRSASKYARSVDSAPSVAFPTATFSAARVKSIRSRYFARFSRTPFYDLRLSSLHKKNAFRSNSIV